MPKKLVRIGLLGDIHAEDVRLERALEFLQQRGLDAIVATGDIADGIGSVDRCCALLMSHQVVTVAGNHDRWLLANSARDLPLATRLESTSPDARDFLQTLPRIIELETVSGRALLCHGIGPNDMAQVGPDDFGYALDSNSDLQNLLRNRYYRWVLNGHSHRVMVRHFGPLSLINGGTLASDSDPGFMEVDFGTNQVHYFGVDPTGEVQEPRRCFSLEPSPIKGTGRGPSTKNKGRGP